MHVPKYVPKGLEKHRVRLSRVECEFIFVSLLNKLIQLDETISEYEKAKDVYKKHKEYVEQFPTPRGPNHKTFDKAVLRLKELEHQVQPGKIKHVLRLYDKMFAILEKPRLKPKFISVRDDISEWIRFPSFADVS